MNNHMIVFTIKLEHVVVCALFLESYVKLDNREIEPY